MHIMGQRGSDMKRLSTTEIPSFASRLAYWTAIFGVNLYDLLGLCHIVPVHTLHLHRPFMMSGSQFRNNRRKKVST